MPNLTGRPGIMNEPWWWEIAPQEMGVLHAVWSGGAGGGNVAVGGNVAGEAGGGGVAGGAGFRPEGTVELPKPTKDPRNAIASSVDDALSKTGDRVLSVQVRVPYCEPYLRPQIKGDATRRVFREFEEALRKKATFTSTQGFDGEELVARVVIMSVDELHRLRKQIAEGVIAECVKQGYFR